MHRPYSGVGVYTFSLLSALFAQNKKHHFTLFTNGRKTFPLPRFPYEHISYATFRYPNKLLNASFSLFNAPSIDALVEKDSFEKNHSLKEPTPPIDLIFSPNWLFSSYSGKSKLILTIHDLAIFRVPEYFSARQKLWHWAIRIQRLVSLADAIICVSENTYEDVKTIFDVSEDQLFLIHEGVDPLFFHQHEESVFLEIKEKYHLPERYVLTIGNIEPRKNILGMIESFERYREISRDDTDTMHFVIGGSGGWNTKYERFITKRIRSSPYHDDIHLIGYISEEDKQKVMSHAKAFIFLSFYEGFGLPPLEAMACGTPVIASYASSLPEILGNAAILVDPHNINDTASVLLELLENQTLWERHRSIGLQRTKLFPWEKTASETMKVFESL
jgi:glycosyltransferase involved in cell wall biosynthesis